MIDDAGQEITLDMWYRLLEQKQNLLDAYEQLRRDMGYYAACIQCRIDGDDLPLWNMRDGLLEQAGMTIQEAMIASGFWEDEEE